MPNSSTSIPSLESFTNEYYIPGMEKYLDAAKQRGHGSMLTLNVATSETFGDYITTFYDLKKSIGDIENKVQDYEYISTKRIQKNIELILKPHKAEVMEILKKLTSSGGARRRGASRKSRKSGRRTRRR